MFNTIMLIIAVAFLIYSCIILKNTIKPSYKTHFIKNTNSNKYGQDMQYNWHGGYLANVVNRRSTPEPLQPYMERDTACSIVTTNY